MAEAKYNKEEIEMINEAFNCRGSQIKRLVNANKGQIKEVFENELTRLEAVRTKVLA